MTKGDVSAYRDYPEGSISKQLYDYFHLSFQEYLCKYYADRDLSDWKRFLNHYVLPSFESSTRAGYVSFLSKMGAPFRPDFERLEEYWKKLNDDKRFDEELNRFFSFLGGCGFYDQHQITFEHWLTMKYWTRPKVKEIPNDARTILEIVSYKYGLNFLKIEMMHIPWLVGH